MSQNLVRSRLECPKLVRTTKVAIYLLGVANKLLMLAGINICVLCWGE